MVTGQMFVVLSVLADLCCPVFTNCSTGTWTTRTYMVNGNRTDVCCLTCARRSLLSCVHRLEQWDVNNQNLHGQWYRTDVYCHSCVRRSLLSSCVHRLQHWDVDNEDLHGQWFQDRCLLSYLYSQISAVLCSQTGALGREQREPARPVVTGQVFTVLAVLTELWCPVFTDWSTGT